jgi:predicted TIM-barrel fold metal-dependent hydrolase
LNRYITISTKESNMSPDISQAIDAHMHVGLLGDKWPQWGKFSPWYQKQIVYKIFLLYGKIKEEEVNDEKLLEETIKTVEGSGLGKVVCLALDHVYDLTGTPHPDKSHMWVSTDYIVQELMPRSNKILLGASAHPYDPNFNARVQDYVEKGAVLLKWLPSAQHIDLAEDKTRDAMISLATAKPDKLANFFRGSKKWLVPKVEKIRDNLEAALNAGAVIIFAHCGLPYFEPGFLGGLLEHSEFKTVQDYLARTDRQEFAGVCYADVSAVCTPFRKNYFGQIKNLPPSLVLFGSDFPTPAFELSADLAEVWDDFKAVLRGEFERVIIPQDNLLKVNYNELNHFFPDHPMFTNFNRLL